MYSTSATFLLLLTTLLLITPVSKAAVHAFENFGLDQIEQRSDVNQYSKKLREGFRLSKAGKHEQAFKIFSEAAKNDELTAYLVLGVLHRDGIGTQKNIQLAKESFKKAADKGSQPAEEELVLLRFQAPDNPAEFAAARTQLEKFAQDDMAVAQLRLGLAHLSGYGYPADEAKAIELLTKATQSSGPFKSEAMLALGKVYLKGNPKLAESWIKKAAELNHVGAMRALGEFYLDSHPEKQNYTRAHEWFLRLSNQNDPYGHYYLGQMIENGWGVKKSLASAAAHYRRASAQKVPAAIYRLAYFQEHGLGGLQKNTAKASALYREGAELGHPVCMYNLAIMLDNLDGESPLKAEVMPWLLRSAGTGLIQAEHQIGLRYLQGHGVQQDYVAAAAWFDRAARAGHAESQLSLGEMYEKGMGVKANLISARQLYQLSANSGNLGGQLKYTEMLANGLGGNKDLAEAYVYAEKAIATAKPETEGSQVAKKLRDELLKIMTPEQVEEGKKRLASSRKKTP